MGGHGKEENEPLKPTQWQAKHTQALQILTTSPFLRIGTTSTRDNMIPKLT